MGGRLHEVDVVVTASGMPRATREAIAAHVGEPVVAPVADPHHNAHDLKGTS